MHAAKSSIQSLDSDCLRQILSELGSGADLRSVSLTCKWLRNICLDLLFEKCIALSALLEDPARGFPPAHLWTYIRKLRMLGSFEPDINGRSDWKADPQLPSDANTGGSTNSLADVLSAMPNLCHVVVVDKEERGVPWPILKAILLAPPLRSFDLFGRLPVSTQGDMTFKSSFGPTHLTSFRYIPDDSRKLSKGVPSEKRVLNVLLEKLSSTLQVLHLPCKSVPFRELKSWDWPHLQELYLRGDGRSLRNLGAPLVSTLSCMPRLRRLSLKLGRTEGHKRFGAIWPPNCPITVIPWPELESLTVTWVDAEEQLFKHLPSTFRDLHLRAWPRFYRFYSHSQLRSKARRVSWAQECPVYSSVARVVEDCRHTSLECLELEYIACSDDVPLYRLIAQSYPDLRWLQLLRYRVPGSPSNVPAAELSEALSALQNLQNLRLYLDFNPLVMKERWQATTHNQSEQVTIALRHFAREPFLSLPFIQILGVTANIECREQYRVQRNPDGAPSVTFITAHRVNRDFMKLADTLALRVVYERVCTIDTASLLRNAAQSPSCMLGVLFDPLARVCVLEKASRDESMDAQHGELALKRHLSDIIQAVKF